MSPRPAESGSDGSALTRRGLGALGATLGFGGVAASGLGLGGLLGALWRAVATDAGRALLRPPGAGAPDAFLAACIRCGQCAQACPVDALRMEGLAAGRDCGTPYVVPRAAPCNLCQGYDMLRCIAACPTTALGPVAAPEDVRMGRARIDEATCLAFHDAVCRACWHACPFPDLAITLGPRGRPHVEDACVGCGLCDRACLTEPSSITIVPAGTEGAA